VRGQKVAVKVDKLDEAIVMSLPNDVTITIGRTSRTSSSTAVAADGVLRMYPRDTVDVAMSGLVPGTIYTIFMFSDPVELGRGIASADGTVTETVAVPADAEFGDHTVQLNGVGPGGEMVSMSMGFKVLERTSTTGIVIVSMTAAILLALLGGRPIFVNRRRRRDRLAV